MSSWRGEEWIHIWLKFSSAHPAAFAEELPCCELQQWRFVGQLTYSSALPKMTHFRAFFVGVLTFMHVSGGSMTRGRKRNYKQSKPWGGIRIGNCIIDSSSPLNTSENFAGRSSVLALRMSLQSRAHPALKGRPYLCPYENSIGTTQLPHW